jgi:hypothetical protein
VECFGGGGRESPMKHGARGQHGRGGASTGRGGMGGRAGKDRAGGSSTGALCTEFTLVLFVSNSQC